MPDIPKIKLNLKALGTDKAKQTVENSGDNSGEEKIHEKALLQEVDSGVKEINTQETPIEKKNLKGELKDETIVNIEESVTENNEGENKKGYIQLESINKYVKEEKEKHVKKQETLQQKEENQDEEALKEEKDEIHFLNYTSYFEKQSKNVFKRIQNFRYAPKTRTGLLVSLIFLTGFIIGGAMFFFPEKHSFTIYKASILEIYGEGAVTKSNDTINDIPDIDIPDPSDDTPSGNIPEEENTDLRRQEIRNERLKEHLLKKYSN